MSEAITALSTARRRIADLNTIIEVQEALEPGGGWFARMFRDTLLTQLDAQKPRTNSEELAAILTSGLAGLSLLRELWDRFPSASRSDVYLGVAIAITTLRASLQLAELDAAVAVAEAT